MSITDPISDMLTMLRNAGGAKKAKADIPYSKLKLKIADILKREGFIKDFKLLGEGQQKTLRVYLKFSKSNRSAITYLRRVSKPGLRMYVKKDYRLPAGGRRRVSILSTSKGIMAGKEARAQGLGGELLCYVW